MSTDARCASCQGGGTSRGTATVCPGEGSLEDFMEEGIVLGGWIVKEEEAVQ